MEISLSQQRLPMKKKFNAIYGTDNYTFFSKVGVNLNNSTTSHFTNTKHIIPVVKSIKARIFFLEEV